jgi:hypothetical protein
MPDKLPVYKCVIEDQLDSDLQVEFVSFVDKPAIDRNFLAFKNQLRFSIDPEKHIVSGPAMLADMLIYRNDPQGLGEYYTTFDKEAIMSIVQKFFKKGFVQNFNLMHDANNKQTGITVFESFVTDEARGIKPMKGFEDAKEGSWFISAKVENEEVWNKIKDGTVKGFSVEGIFKQIPVTMQKLSADIAVEKIKAILASLEN